MNTNMEDNKDYKLGYLVGQNEEKSKRSRNAVLFAFGFFLLGYWLRGKK